MGIREFSPCPRKVKRIHERDGRQTCRSAAQHIAEKVLAKLLVLVNALEENLLVLVFEREV